MTPPAAHGYAPYEPRLTAYHGIRERAGHRLKTYSIRVGESPIDWPAFEAGIERALDALPVARPEAGRPGLGFVIAHQGRGMDYVILAWWARENELPVRVEVREEGGAWRPAGEESFCVWDLELMAREREAYVETMLGGNVPDAPGAYLARIACEP